MLYAILGVKSGEIRPLVYENQKPDDTGEHFVVFQRKDFRRMMRRIIVYCLKHNLPFDAKAMGKIARPLPDWFDEPAYGNFGYPES